MTSTTAPTASAAAEYETPWMSFDDLPEVAKQAIRSQSQAAPEEQEAYARTHQWQYTQVPVAAVAERVMAADPDLVADHGTFAAYHAWYVSRGDIPDHGESHWPSIEAQPGTGEYLSDGWHRFHSYVGKGMTVVPVLRARDPQRHA